MSILQAVRNENGEVTDIEIMLVNKEHERVMGRKDLIGLHYVKEYPGMKQSVLFDLIVKTIETGEPQEAEYFYPYEGFNSWFNSMFMKLNDGVVAVTMDISARKLAEEEMRKMEAEKQLEIFRVSLRTVEEERYRISESLHNGLGQLLYAIKINFSVLSQGMDENTFKKSKVYANQLLTDAIMECRRISHELMPTVLEEFGLKAAINDVCQQMQSGIHLTCITNGLTKRMDKYLELVVYRTVQELLTNVVKHAKATEAKIVVAGSSNQIAITVSDNGKGMEEPRNGLKGIGLASIRSKIKLLNGTITIYSNAESGTTIAIIIPKPAL